MNQQTATSPHFSVMLAEVLAVLAPKDGALYIDGTFGAGGYSRALLDAANCQVIAVDRDPTAIARGRAMETEFEGRLTLVEGCFGDMAVLIPPVLAQRARTDVDGIALDIGVSSMQIDQAERGFSFQADGPLDMRMSGEGVSAADVVNNFDASDIASILWTYGEEKRSRAIAKAIVERRTEEPFTRTGDLAALIAKVMGAKARAEKVHPATRTFQALRIFVNDELGELARGLSACEDLLAPGGRLAVVSFHSLEDRMVKRFLVERTGKAARPSRHMPIVEAGPEASFIEVTRGADQASKSEIDVNARSRSAKLRGAERTDAPALQFDLKALGLQRFQDLQRGLS
ncbi:MAG: 16S rRNA (cytosine(1402)-N(4))-methyltransferase RsmH [Parvibaculum sp.]